MEPHRCSFQLGGLILVVESYSPTHGQVTQTQGKNRRPQRRGFISVTRIGYESFLGGLSKCQEPTRYAFRGWGADTSFRYSWNEHQGVTVSTAAYYVRIYCAHNKGR